MGVLIRTPEALLEMLGKAGLRRSSSSMTGSGCRKSTLDFFVTMRSESEDTLFMRTWVRGRGGGTGLGCGDGERGDSGGSGSINRPGGKTSEEGLIVRSPLHLGV